MGKKTPMKMDVKPENIPQSLRDHKAWVVWDWNEQPQGWRKLPAGRWGGPTDWMTFDEAVTRYRNGGHSGVGYVFDVSNGVVGVDIDGCRNRETGEITPVAQDVIDNLATYTEISPSGTGVKMFLRAEILGKWRRQFKDDQIEIEIYDNKRFFTVTGWDLGGRDVSDAGAYFRHLLVKYMRSEDKTVRRPHDTEAAKEQARQALEFVDPICIYSKWVDIGMALKWLGDDCFHLWDEWSSRAGNDVYPGSDALRDKWESFPAEGRITLGTLIYYAKENGYEPPSKQYEDTDLGLAQRVADANDDNLLYVDEVEGGWVVWDGRKYNRKSGKAEVMWAIERASREMEREVQPPEDPEDKEAWKLYHQNLKAAKRYRSAGGIRDASSLLMCLLQESQSAFNLHHTLLPCSNGVLDVLENRFTEHDKSLRFTVCTNTVYDPTAKCPRWNRFIEEITCGDDDLAYFLQRLCGYCLTGNTEDQAIYLLYGQGSNGKSVFTNVLLDVLGELGGTVNQELLVSKNDQDKRMAELHGKRCVVAQETDQDAKLQEHLVKMLTGQDEVQARKLYQNIWTFKPTHKILLATNHLPLIKGTENGIWRRIKIVPFNAMFSGDAVDPELVSKLKAEKSGILNWMIAGLQAYTFDGLDAPECSRQLQNEYREELDPIRLFVEEECELDPQAATSTASLFRAYRYYAEERGYHAGSLRRFSQGIKSLGFEDLRTKTQRMKKGLKLREEQL